MMHAALDELDIEDDLAALDRLLAAGNASVIDSQEHFERGVSVALTAPAGGATDTGTGTGTGTGGGQCAAAVLSGSSQVVAGGGRASLASEHLVGIDCEAVNGSQPPSPEAAGRLLVIKVPVDAPLPGGGNCTPVRDVLGPLPPLDETCVAGCCIEGRCVCRLGYTGERCDLELLCAVVPQGFTRLMTDLSDGGSDRACATEHEIGSSRLVCTCARRTGTIAVVKFRIQPATNLLALSYAMPEVRQQWLWAYGAALAGYTLLMVVALHWDTRTQYIAADHPSVPEWLRPRPTSLFSELLVTVRLRTSLVRIWYVYAGHTLYTRTQLLHVLACSLAFSLLSVVAFMGRAGENCTDLANLVAFLAVTASSILATAVRLIFRCSNLHSSRHIKAVYYANKRARLAAKLQRGGEAAMIPGCARSDNNCTVGAYESAELDVGAPPRSPPLSPPPLAVSGRSTSSIAEVTVELGERVASPPPQLIGDTRRPSSAAGAALVPPRAKVAPKAGSRTVLLDHAIKAGAKNARAQGARAQGARSMDARAKGRHYGQALARVRLSVHQLSTDPNGSVAVGFHLRAHGKPAFVAASHISGTLLSRRVTVQYAPAALPLGVSEPSRSNVMKSPQVALWLGGAGWFSWLAWAVNTALLLVATFATMLVFEARERLPLQLQAASVEDASWHAAVREACFLSLLQSFLLIDFIKVLCLTLTSDLALARAGMRKRSGKCFARPIRRFHKLLDWFL